MRYDFSGEIETTVAWWVKQLREQPKADAGSVTIESFYAFFTAAHERPSEAAIGRFEVTLYNWLGYLLNAKKPCYEEPWGDLMIASRNAWTALSTDYTLQGDLKSIAEHTGIPLYCFPIKSYTSIYPGAVIARLGYSGKEEVIYRKGA